jgi:hypothetical protein
MTPACRGEAIGEVWCVIYRVEFFSCEVDFAPIL